MEYKEGLDDMSPIMACDMCRIRRKREEALQYVKAFQPGLAFNDETRKISFEKYTDLSKLLDYIPPIHHGFYSGLSHHTKTKSQVITEHPDIVDSDSERNLESENLENNCV